ncbi:MAG: helix-turn-helix transcriptional regulator [Archangium sp.]|nr:helix-turn-helix transcriptional regulator [Archangium sp.]
MSQPAISKHIKVLEQAGLVTRGTEGHRRSCRIVAKPLGEATAFLEDYRRFWEKSFERLDELLGDMKRRPRR